ncbi:hypothetical protein RIR_jg3454.t1 [Rhizophagus irregularis DAOM 181602=DAOM 197198]|nr:hypothetical protein RIR_jg33244.t1 [Rhizophagus irregularis DAOM 181602=DAOM 197198]GET51879.1 hypothetical protein RIR_jg3454.t1 [Rhizophagus irregularis DAOM 181602=DAOM 197198]
MDDSWTIIHDSQIILNNILHDFWMVSINFLDNYVMVLMVVLTPLFTLFSRILLCIFWIGNANDIRRDEISKTSETY